MKFGWSRGVCRRKSKQRGSEKNGGKEMGPVGVSSSGWMKKVE